MPFKSWKPPKEGWSNVSGTNEKLEELFPFEPNPNKKVGAGVLIMEPDGRVWLTRPTNGFGGYQHTFPKGTAESGLTLQQNAIKEAYEETGLKVKIVGIVGDVERDTSKARYYLARRVGGTPKDMGWESQALRLSPRKQAKELLNRTHDKELLDNFFEEMKFGKAKGGATKAESTGKPGHWQFQERWPSGSALGGQWKAMGADGITAPPKIAGGLEGANSVYQKAANLAHETTQGSPTPNQLQQIIDKYAPAAAKFAAGGKTTSHVKWGAQVHQYATQVQVDFKAKGAATATADKLQGPQKLSIMTPMGAKPGGSNPGGMYSDSEGKWLVKGSNATLGGAALVELRSRNELLASKLMQAVGAGAPDMKLVDLEGKHGGGIGVASKWIDGGQAFDPKNPAHMAAAQADFAVHAWLANYDALGMSMDNTQIVGGKAVNIDPGGALLYRAQGAPKGDAFKNSADEWDSMRDPAKNPNGAKVYGSMTASQLAASAEKLKAIDQATLGKIVHAYGPGTYSEKGELVAKLLARKADILARVAALQGAAAQPTAPAPAAPPVAPVAPPAAKPAASPAPASPMASLAGIKTFGEKVTFVGGGSDKFWQVGIFGKYVITQWGKNGTEGQQAIKEMPTAMEAAKEAGKMLAAKEAKGYTNGKYVDMTIKAPPAAAASAAPAPAPSVAPVAAPAAALVASPATAAAPAKPKVGSILNPVFDGIHAAKFETTAAALNRMSADELKQAMSLVANKGGNYVQFKSGDTVLVTVKNPPKSTDAKKIVNMYNALVAQKSKAAAAPPPPPPPAPAPAIEKPTGWPQPISVKYYTEMANKAEKLHASGDLKGLLLLGGWPAGTANGAKMTAYYNKLVKDLEAKEAAANMAKVQTAQAAVSAPTTPPANGPALPNFEKFKLPASNSNAASHNPKIDLIAKLASSGDVKGLLSLNYGTNNYGKKQAQLANDALQALGSPFAVTAGQKKFTHPALSGGLSPVKVQQAAAVSGIPAPQPHPAASKQPVDMTALDMSKAAPLTIPKFDKSSKAWVNESNNKLAAEINAAFLSGNYQKLQQMQYQTLDKESGTPGGMKHISEHPAKEIQYLYQGALTAMREIAHPPKPLKVFQAQHAESVAAIDAAFPPKPFGTTVKQVKSNEQVGYWVALGKIDDVKSITPGATMSVSDTDTAKAYSDYKTKSNKLVKAFIQGIQASGSYNDLFRKGAKTDSAGNNLKDVAEAALAYAQPKPAGTKITRWQNMTQDMIKKLESLGAGAVLSATGPMCCSKSATATKGFGSHRLNIIYAEGAKAVDSFGSGGYQGEEEITTLPNARFVVLKVGKMSNGNSDITLLMLPPNIGTKTPPPTP